MARRLIGVAVVFDPEPGTNERHEFRLEGNILIIQGVTGTLRLVKR